MAGDELESPPGEGPNPFESPRPWRIKLASQCHDDLAELRDLADSGRRREATELLQCLPMLRFGRPDHRRELGEICAELGYPVLAGRWWYLEECKTPQMLAACREFEHSCGENPLLICDALGDWIDAPQDSYSHRRFAELQSRAIEIRRRHAEDVPAVRRWKDRLLTFGCFLMFVAIVAVFLAGLGAIAALFLDVGPWRL
jgi:uncharacterized protein DUF6584